MYRRKGCKHCHCSSRDSIANTRKYCASNKGNITTRQQKELVSLNTIWICNFLRQDATNAMQIKYFSLYMMQLMLRECLLQDAALFDKQEIQGLKCCKYYANIRFVAPNKRVQLQIVVVDSTRIWFWLNQFAKKGCQREIQGLKVCKYCSNQRFWLQMLQKPRKWEISAPKCSK